MRRNYHLDGCGNIFHFVIAKCSDARFAVDKPGEISHNRILTFSSIMPAEVDEVGDTVSE